MKRGVIKGRENEREEEGNRRTTERERDEMEGVGDERRERGEDVTKEGRGNEIVRRE